jgi:uncharacterized membrane protein YccC
MAVPTLRRTLTRFDKAKINNPWLALRNALAVALPLAIGIATGNPLGAVAITTGALNVAYADGNDPYAQRARRMLAWSVLGGVAVFTGSITGEYNWAAIPVAALWAFIAGMLLSISSRAGDLGLNTLVTLIVFGARGALSPKGALYAGLLVVGGGLLQTLFSLLLWPVRRYEPERQAIAKVYLDLEKEVDPNSERKASTPLNPPSSQMQDVITALGRDRSLEGERLRLLFDQADRIRLSVFLLGRLRSELQHEERKEAAHHAVAYFDELLAISSKLLGAVGRCLVSNQCAEEQPYLLQRLHELVDRAQAYKAETPSALAEEVASAEDALAGQLRAIVRLAGHTTPEGASEFLKLEEAPPWRLQLSHWLATVRANLDIRSSVFRHALRLTVCVAIADAIGRGVSWNRSYWLPMTVAVILKPDFTTTFARGTLRLIGTFAGLLVATLLFHLFPASAAALAQLILVGAYTFFLRWIGPANYGIFSVAISGLIVFLIAATGVSPAQVVTLRALNTALGGVFALIAYALWPTWERTQVSQAMADMLDACRLYFRAVVERFAQDNAALETELDERRADWRRARSNAEGSVDRVAAEPGTAPQKLDCLNSMLASSHALTHSIMALEAGILRSPAHTSPEAFQVYANDVELTLYFLAAALRGWSGAQQNLPKLRDDHRRMLQARGSFSPADEFVLLETDRLTVSLNTLREQVLRYTGQ